MSPRRPVNKGYFTRYRRPSGDSQIASLLGAVSRGPVARDTQTAGPCLVMLTSLSRRRRSRLDRERGVPDHLVHRLVPAGRGRLDGGPGGYRGARHSGGGFGRLWGGLGPLRSARRDDARPRRRSRWTVLHSLNLLDAGHDFRSRRQRGQFDRVRRGRLEIRLQLRVHLGLAHPHAARARAAISGVILRKCVMVDLSGRVVVLPTNGNRTDSPSAG